VNQAQSRPLQAGNRAGLGPDLQGIVGKIGGKQHMLIAHQDSP
jgi:hypothetical protein